MPATLKDLTPGLTVYVRQGDIIGYDTDGVRSALWSTALLPGGQAADAVEVQMTTHGHIEFRHGRGSRARWVNLVVG